MLSRRSGAIRPSSHCPAIAFGDMTDLATDVALARRWWDELVPFAPADVAGLWFGIFTGITDGQAQRTLYVVGTATFDAKDETAEWAADDYVWQAEGRYVVL